MIGVNGFVSQGTYRLSEKRKTIETENEKEAEEMTEDVVEEESISDYYLSKIDKYVNETQSDRHVLEIADNTEERQFVTSGQLLSRQAKNVSAEEYEILTRIVEAEAGGEPYETRLLVTNIILNRVDSPRFPNTITHVVFANNGRNYQFSPLSNGSYYRVKIQPSTRKAVEDAINGKDNSRGALYFMVRKWSTAGNIKWFDNHLTKLGQIGTVEFFK